MLSSTLRNSFRTSSLQNLASSLNHGTSIQQISRARLFRTKARSFQTQQVLNSTKQQQFPQDSCGYHIFHSENLSVSQIHDIFKIDKNGNPDPKFWTQFHMTTENIKGKEERGSFGTDIVPVPFYERTWFSITIWTVQLTCFAINCVVCWVVHEESERRKKEIVELKEENVELQEENVELKESL